MALRSLARPFGADTQSNVFNSIFRGPYSVLSAETEIVSEIDVAENNVPFPHDNFLIRDPTHRAKYIYRCRPTTSYHNYRMLREKNSASCACEKSIAIVNSAT